MEHKIPITTNSDGNQIISARDLHDWLCVGKDFTNWIKGRINKYELINEVDYTVIHTTISTAVGGRPKIEYILNINKKTDALIHEELVLKKKRMGSEGNKHHIFTYVIKDIRSNIYKIGKTTDLQGRVSNIMTCNIYAILYMSRRGDVEKKLHEEYKDKRIMDDREWFELSDADLTDIETKYNFIRQEI